MANNGKLPCSYRYEVQKNDSLASIAVREGVPISTLKRLNRLSNDALFPGQVLILRKGSAASESAGNTRTVPVQQQAELHQAKMFPPRSDLFSWRGALLSGLPSEMPTLSSLFKLSLSRGLFTVDHHDDHVSGQLQPPPAAAAAVHRNLVDSEPPTTIRLPTLLQPSEIINATIAAKLSLHLPDCDQNASWRLLYSDIKNGTDISTFYRQCRRRAHTILIAQSITGEIFGGFNADLWKVDTGFYGSGQCFVFRAANIESDVEVYRWTGENTCFVWCTPDQIDMGGGQDGFAFILENNFSDAGSAESATFRNKKLFEIPSGSLTKRIKNVECWGFEFS